MANEYSQIRVGLDWEKKGIICWGATPTDPLNQIHRATTMSEWAYGSQWTYKVWADGRHTPLPFYWEGTIDMTAHDANLFLFATGMWGVGAVPDNTVPVTPGQTYTLVINADITGTIGGPDEQRWFAIDFWDSGGSFIEQHITLIAMSGNTTITVTAPAGAAHLCVELKFIYGWGNNYTNIIVNSLMLFTGTVSPVPAFNSGTLTCLYDEITGYVIRANGEIGYAERSSLMPNEGSVTLTLRNDGRRFTPKLITGVYPGAYTGDYLDIGKSIVVQMNGPNGWRRAFVGEITEVQVETGVYRERTVTITASQTIQAMSRHSGDIGIVPGRTLAEHIRTLFKSSGAYTSWVYPFIATDIDTFPLDAGALYDEDGMFSATHEGEVTDNPGVTMAWPQNLAEIIRQVIDYDGGVFFVHEDARTSFVSYNGIDLLPLAMVAAYGDFVEDEYVYDGDISNIFQIDYEDRPMNVAPTYVTLGENTLRMNVGTDNDITIVYDFSDEEYDYANHIGQTLTITKVSDGSIIGSGVGISFVSELDTSGRTDNSGNAGWGTQVTFRLYNYTGFQVDVKVEVNGIACVPSGNELTEYRVDDSILLYGQLSKSFDNPFITNDARRTTYGDRKREQLAFPRQYFKKLTTVIGPATYQYLGLNMGDVIKLDYEYQTDNTLMPLIVIGKSFDWEPQKLQFTLTLGPLEQFGALGPLGP